MFSQLRYVIEHEIIAPIRECVYAVIFGSEKITPIYALKGVLTNIQFTVILAFLCVFYSIFECFHNPLLTYIAALFLFYAVLTSTQKRCRDFGSAGTFWIAVISAVFIGDMAFHFIDYKVTGIVYQQVSSAIVNLKIVTYLFLMIIPGKPDPDPKLRSPLMKYPLGYTAFCFILAILATIAVNYLANV